MTLIDETDSPTEPLAKKPLGADGGGFVVFDDERPAHATTMLDKLNQLRRNKQFCDVTLQVIFFKLFRFIISPHERTC